MADSEKVTVDVTTPVGILCFPHLFPSTASEKTDNAGNKTGEKSYDVQILIPKSDREGIRNILRAIKTVGEAKWGDNWKRVRSPLRDGDKEAGELASDGKTTKGEKYPERLGHVFINARSSKPVGVFDRQRVPINDVDAVYGGCFGRISVSFYPYAQQGNSGIGAGLNGVQKIRDGEPFGAGAPTVESMFDMLDDEDIDLDAELGEEPEPTPPPAKKAAAKKAPAKKAAAKKAAAPEPVAEEVDDLDDLDEFTGGGEEDDDLYDDLD